MADHDHCRNGRAAAGGISFEEENLGNDHAFLESPSIVVDKLSGSLQPVPYMALMDKSEMAVMQQDINVDENQPCK